MAYRTIPVHVDRSAAAEARIRLAGRLAAREEAHLAAIATCGVPTFMYPGAPVDASGAFIADYLEQAGKRAGDALQRFDAVTAAMVLALVQRRTCQDDAYAAICPQARCADLLDMGAYGHSRLREVVLGGATRVVLDAMTLPVLMAH